MASTTTEFNVEITCGGCVKAVTAMLKKVEGSIPSLGVQDINCNVEARKVTVTGTASPSDMLAAIQKTGKKASIA